MRFSDVLAGPGVRETVVLRGDLGLLAPHGSNMEDGTERIAAAVAERCGASLYSVTYPGTWEEARTLHVSGVLIEPDATEALAAFTAHCRTVIAVHGYTREAMRHTALVGGRNAALAGLVAEELEARLPEPADVLAGAAVPAGLRGTSPQNLTNRFPEEGCQIELPPRLRVSYPSRIFWGGCTPNENIYAEAVIDALSAALKRYTDAYVSLRGDSR
jgi:phage replication-related protein YjqB (UPF0714/DUF867 family)